MHAVCLKVLICVSGHIAAVYSKIICGYTQRTCLTLLTVLITYCGCQISVSHNLISICCLVICTQYQNEIIKVKLNHILLKFRTLLVRTLDEDVKLL